MSGLSIQKQLITMEDLACGQGSIQQERQGLAYTLGKVDVPYCVATEAALSAVNISLFTYARIGEQDYRYDSSFTTGDVSSAFSTSFWRKVSKPLVGCAVSDLPDASAFKGVMLGLTDHTGRPSPVVYSDGTKWYYMNNVEVA